MSFWKSLRERKLVQWALAYLAGAWLVLQVTDILGNQFAWPGALLRSITVLLAFGFLAALVVAWYHGEKGQQRVSGIELLMLSALLVLTGAAVTFVGGSGASEGQSAALASASSAPAPEPRSVAVLPFANLSADPDNAYFSDGITEEILTHLSKIGNLRVISRTSVMQYKDTQKPLRQIGQELGVAHELEGSVRRAGDRVRITAQLINARTDAHLWSETYDRQLTDVFEIQSDIARQVTSALQARLTASDSAHIAAGRTESLEAYDFFIRGREFLRSPGAGEERIRAAMALFRRALALDPGYARAEAALSEAYFVLALRSERTAFLEARDSAQAIAQRAVARAPDLAEAYFALAWAYGVQGQARPTLEAVRRAVELNPSHGGILGLVGLVTGVMGAPDEALPWIKRAIAATPMEPDGYVFLAYFYTTLGGVPEAQHWYRRALEIDPSNAEARYGLATLALRQGERARVALIADTLAATGHTGAAAHLRLALTDDAAAGALLAGDAREPVRQRQLLVADRALVLQRQGRAAEAEPLIRRMEAEARERIAMGDEIQIPYQLLSMAAALRGNHDEALRWLRVWIERGLRDPDELRLEPVFALLREDPRFQTILGELEARRAQMRERALREGWW